MSDDQSFVYSQVGVYILNGPEEEAHIVLGYGERMVLFIRHERPVVVQIDEPGTYQVHGMALVEKPTTHPFPAVIICVPESHAASMALLSPLVTNSAIDNVLEATKAGRPLTFFDFTFDGQVSVRPNMLN